MVPPDPTSALISIFVSSMSSFDTATDIERMMKLVSIAALAASASAFVPANTGGPSSTQLRVEIGSTGVEFENVAREWRCE